MANKTRTTLLYKVPSATFRFTYGDSYVFLDFVDRSTSIKYKKRSKTGTQLLKRMRKYGDIKVTYPV